MKIETKFDIGDKVWAIQWFFTGKVEHYKKLHKWRIKGAEVIDGILITKIRVWYIFESDTQLIHGAEYILSTKDKAQAECDKRNEENKMTCKKCGTSTEWDCNNREWVCPNCDWDSGYRDSKFN